MAEVQIDKLTVEIEADTTNATKGLDRLKKAMDNLSSKKAVSETNLLGGAFSNLLNKAKRLISIVAISQTLGKAIAKYSEYAETVNLFSVAMGEYADKGAKIAEEIADKVQIDVAEAMKNMAMFQNLTTSFGMDSDRAFTLSTNLTKLGYDLASLNNIPFETAFEKLQAALAGYGTHLKFPGKHDARSKISGGTAGKNVWCHFYPGTYCGFTANYCICKSAANGDRRYC